MPRSPSRDLSDRFAGDRDYFRQSDGVRRWKWGLSAVALVAALGWAASDRAAPSRAAFAHSHGALAGPHAAWENDCGACHVPKDAEGFGLRSLLFGTRERWRDLTCEKCHAGPDHHAAARPAEAQRDCAACHRDHAGKGTSLTRLADASCTNCHGDLSGHAEPVPSAYAARVVDFAGHPEFRELAENPPGKPYARRGLKFSHALHMTPGQVYAKDARGAFSLDRLPEADRARYRKGDQPDTAPVQLECASCHRLDGAPGAAAVPRTDGAYYLPVNYETDCKACHALAAPANVAVGKHVLPSFPLPHRVQPAELRSTLKGEYAARLLAEKPALMKPSADDPGGRLDPPLDRPEVKAYGEEVERLTRSAFDQIVRGRAVTAAAGGASGPGLSGGYACAKCHDVEGEGKDQRIEPVLARAADPRARARGGRAVWFEHAKFNHAPHRGLTCAGCHPGTEAAYRSDGTTDAVEREPVRIAGIETCRQCHAPASVVGGAPVGGVRHGCTDCHRFHGGDQPLHGRGGKAGEPSDPLTAAEFLRGGRRAAE